MRAACKVWPQTCLQPQSTSGGYSHLRSPPQPAQKLNLLLPATAPCTQKAVPRQASKGTTAPLSQGPAEQGSLWMSAYLSPHSWLQGPPICVHGPQPLPLRTLPFPGPRQRGGRACWALHPRSAIVLHIPRSSPASQRWQRGAPSRLDTATFLLIQQPGTEQ